jgi:hypothetical protein
MIPVIILNAAVVTLSATAQIFSNLLRDLAFTLLGLVTGKLLHERYAKKLFSRIWQSAVLFLLSPTIQVGNAFYYGLPFILTGAILGAMDDNNKWYRNLNDARGDQIITQAKLLSEKDPKFKKQLLQNTQNLRNNKDQYISLIYDSALSLFFLAVAVTRLAAGQIYGAILNTFLALLFPLVTRALTW